MGFTKIKEEDLAGRGVVGLPDRPSLSTLDMQKKFDELARDVIIPKFNRFLEELESSILDTLAEVNANTEKKKIAGALALKEYLQYVIENFLPLTGGTLNGALCFNKGKTIINGYGVGTSIVTTDKPNDTSNSRFIDIYNATNCNNIGSAFTFSEFVNGSSFSYRVFGEHNKPTGSYTGNGNSTKRLINTGGIGSAIIIYARSSGRIALLGHHGGIIVDNTNDTQIHSTNTAYFRDGVLQLYTSDANINGNGETYSYQVL